MSHIFSTEKIFSENIFSTEMEGGMSHIFSFVCLCVCFCLFYLPMFCIFVCSCVPCS